MRTRGGCEPKEFPEKEALPITPSHPLMQRCSLSTGEFYSISPHDEKVGEDLPSIYTEWLFSQEREKEKGARSQ